MRLADTADLTNVALRQKRSIATCAPNGAMAEIHNRMPVILDESDWPKWLGEEPATEEELLPLLRPAPMAG
jgi:putative SOS response-associated peptidase YedK